MGLAFRLMVRIKGKDKPKMTLGMMQTFSKKELKEEKYKNA